MRILLIEDDKILGDAVMRTLQHVGYAVDWARDGKAADLALRDQVYDLALLDLGLPQIDGFEVLRRLRNRKSSLPVLIVTARDALDDRIKGLDLGADDYILKPFDMPELLARVRAHIRRAQVAPSTEIVYGPLVFDTTTRLVRINGEPFNLSARELGILETLLMKIGKVITKEMLVEKLCSWDEMLGSNAIEVYVHRLRKKLQPLGVDISTVRGLGYMLEKLDA
ncbi:two-component system [Novimethylophilus kurashikiensis]|uniref:Two-component system n=1 Tax=Novimethylophilus kurashikiensis TaxID=1825523 RepID=A0A2R5FEL8_9PROT|nr:response regulator transcription factor [Novimethylophilus kurashikiensis]GBG15173.1 two-component system [Novimethylophilus kurashikiensis]